MTKKIEQLEVKDLKLAFKEVIEQEWVGVKLDRREMAHLWGKFWDKLKDKCSVVEVL